MATRTRRTPRRRLRLGRLGLVILATLLSGGAVFGLHHVQTRRNAGDLLRRADQATAAGDPAAAARLLRSYGKMRPDDADAADKFTAALEAAGNGRPNAAELIPGYERLLRLDANRPAARRRLAELYVGARAFANARSHLSALVGPGKPADPGLHDLLARCAEGERRFPEAAEHLRAVIAAGPTPDAVGRLAVLLRTELGGPDATAEADGLLNTLVGKRPTDPQAWLTRAAFRRRFGDPTRARADLEHVYNQLPGGADDPQVLQSLAELSLAADDLPAAERLLKKAAGKPATPAHARLTLANLQVRLGRPDAARQTLRDAVDKLPAGDLVLLEAVDRLIDLKELVAAEGQLDRLKPLDQYGPVGDYVRGRLKLAGDDWAAAAPLLRTAADGLGRLANQRFRAYLGLAAAAARANDAQGELDAYDGAVRANPTAAVARFGRAGALLKLGRTREAEEGFAGLAGSDATARAAVASLRLAEQLSKPPADRKWEAVDAACGPDPLPPEVAVVKGKSLAARGKPADAVALLEGVTGRSPLPEAVTELAALKAATGDRAGAYAVLDRAGLREVGDRVAFRLARGRLLAGEKAPDWAAVLALADPAAAGQLPRDDRFELLVGLAGVLSAGNKTAEAADLLRRAAAERPTDLPSRAALFNLLLAANDASGQADLLREFERIEGPDGPVTATARAAQAIPGLKPGDPAVADWRAKLVAARAKRPGWALVHHLLGRVEGLAGNSDAAAEAFRKAFELGDRTDTLVRGLYAALVGRQRYAEAFDLLSRADRERPLPADLGKELLRLQVAFGDDPSRAAAWARSPEATNATSDSDQVLRADALLAAGQPAEAVGPLKKAVGLNPTNAVAWVGLTRLLAALGKDAEAKAAAADAGRRLEAVTTPPAAAAAARLAVGACCEVVGDAAGAEAAFRAAVAADPADVPAHRAVARHLARTGRPADADGFVRGLAGSAPPAVRRWARRELAFAELDRPDWYGRLGTALALVDENLKDGANLPEDVRAKAVVLGADPFRADEAVKLLADSAHDAPLGPDQAYHLARLFLRQAQPDKAEATLKEVVRTNPVTDPELLALLVQVQASGRSVTAARQTLAKLQQLDPKGRTAAVAEARVLAAEGLKPAAAARLLAAGPSDPAERARFAAPLLEETGCVAEAEAVLRGAADPAGPLRLAGFLLRQKRPEEAVKVLLPGDPKTPVGPAARLLAGAVRARPPQLLPEPERSEWERTAREVAEWVRARAEAAPSDPQLLAARATLAAAGGRPEEVVPAFERALAAAPDDPTAKANLAYARAVYARDGSDATLRLVQEAIDRGGPAPTLLDTRAVVHLAGGRPEEAVRDLSAALLVDPKPAYAFHLAQAFDRLAADRPEYARRRDDTLTDAVRRRGLTKAVLDPREWPEFERLAGPVPGR